MGGILTGCGFFDSVEDKVCKKKQSDGNFATMAVGLTWPRFRPINTEIRLSLRSLSFLAFSLSDFPPSVSRPRRLSLSLLGSSLPACRLRLELEPFKSEPKLMIEDFLWAPEGVDKLVSTGDTGSLECRCDGPVEAGGDDERRAPT